MSSEEHVSTARDVFDLAAQTYVEFVGTGINPTTERPIDLSLLVDFIGLIKRQPISRVADVGCGPGRVGAFMADHGLNVIGVDVSRAMLAIACTEHPHIEFEEGRLDALPIESGVLAGAVCWYSIIYTPPDRLGESFDELARVLIPGGYLLLAFQADGEAVHRDDAFGTHLPLTKQTRCARSCQVPGGHRLQDLLHGAQATRTGARNHFTGIRNRYDPTPVAATPWLLDPVGVTLDRFLVQHCAGGRCIAT